VEAVAERRVSVVRVGIPPSFVRSPDGKLSESRPERRSRTFEVLTSALSFGNGRFA